MIDFRPVSDQFLFYRYVPICTRRPLALVSSHWPVVSGTYGVEENFENTARPARFRARALVFQAEFSWPTCRHIRTNVKGTDYDENHSAIDWGHVNKNRHKFFNRLPHRLSCYNPTRTHTLSHPAVLNYCTSRNSVRSYRKNGLPARVPVPRAPL